MSWTLNTVVHAELEVKKSRFLAWVEPVSSREEAQARIEAYRQAYPDARHVCFAFHAGGDSGMSDDGEPSGTAGKPIFSVINHKSLVNVLGVVVRYFGGVKLGAGGLVRAYSGAVSQALETAERVPVETWCRLELECSFARESDVRRLLADYDLNPDNVEYGQGVYMTVVLPESRLVSFRSDFQALAPGDPALAVRSADEATG
ncbi:IMPACT family protein [Saccharospirillum salsuginis]|uniref:Impact N-terminal domain-containing protein n=1 Tax=Saccharospirillum salsuginis TaxID=418750 RepID=A0A918K1C8_9GAMM|nr:YigZ family protein [Saccharospirillum salsuginis]GGX40770.1 hypothetical protein GCM10007392_04440 [Saccharospirillum salsuginis]